MCNKTMGKSTLCTTATTGISCKSINTTSLSRTVNSSTTSQRTRSEGQLPPPSSTSCTTTQRTQRRSRSEGQLLSVSFAPTVHVRPVANRMEYTKSQRHRMWYTPKELQLHHQQQPPQPAILESEQQQIPSDYFYGTSLGGGIHPHPLPSLRKGSSSSKRTQSLPILPVDHNHSTTTPKNEQDKQEQQRQQELFFRTSQYGTTGDLALASKMFHRSTIMKPLHTKSHNNNNNNNNNTNATTTTTNAAATTIPKMSSLFSKSTSITTTTTTSDTQSSRRKSPHMTSSTFTSSRQRLFGGGKGKGGGSIGKLFGLRHQQCSNAAA